MIPLQSPAPRILFVDDDREASELCSMALRLAGYHVDTASSGEKAIEAGARYDAIVTALRLPDCCGLTVLQTVRRLRPDIAVVVVSECATVADAIKAFRNGAIDFIEKPVAVQELVSSVGKALGTERIVAAAARQTDVREILHAADRWAKTIVRVIDSPRDLTTVHAWASSMFVSTGALKNWCRTASVSPRRSLLLARTLRAYIRHHRAGCRFEDSLDVVDKRTLAGILEMAGLSVGRYSTVKEYALDEFLNRQNIVRDPSALMGLRHALSEHPLVTSMVEQQPTTM